MAVAFSNLTEIIDTDQNNSITVTPPSGLAAGDIWLIVVVIDGSAGLTIDTPAGFSNIGSQIVGADDGWPQVKAFYKTAGASESNATVTSTGTDFDSVAYSVRITGTGTLSLDATGTPITPTGTGTTIDAPDITIAENNSLAVLIAASVGTPTFGADQIAAPSGATLRDYRDGNDVYPACGIATQAVNAGSFAPGNWGWGASATNNNNRIAQTFSFKESGGSASAAISGTATASIGEADIVTGGKTVVVTLTGDTFVANTGFPVVEGVAESSVNTAGTSHAVTLPASIAASDLVLILMDIGSTAATLNALTDWEELLDENSANGLKILRYTGSGVPGNPTFTSSASTRSASIAYRISNADKSIAPQIGTTATGSSTTPNPPSVTPTGGVSKPRDVLNHRNEIIRRAIRFSGQGNADSAPDDAAVAMQIAFFHRKGVGLSRQDFPQLGEFGIKIQRMRDFPEISCDQFLGGIADHRTQLPVDAQESTIRCHQRNPDSCLLEGCLEAPLRRGQGTLQPGVKPGKEASHNQKNDHRE